MNLTTPPLTRDEVPDANGEAAGFLFGDNESTSGGTSESHWAEIAFQTGQHPAPPMVLFEHDFENSPLAGPPLEDDPEAGRYTSSSFFVEVLSGPFEDGPEAAAQGEKYLTIDRINSGGTPSLSAFFEGGGFPANTLGLDTEFYFWSSGSANNIAAIGLSNGSSFSGDTHLLWNGIGRFDAWDAEGWEFLGWRFYDGSWNGPGPEITEGEWTKINIHWDGSRATGRVNDGEPFDLGLFGNPEQVVDRIFFTTAVADTIYFVDDIRVSSFRLSVPTGSVELAHEVDGNQLTLSWDGEDFTLQQNPDVTDADGWTDVPEGDTSPVTLPLDQTMNYFRLISR